jgi:hypothetical protein
VSSPVIRSPLRTTKSCDSWSKTRFMTIVEFSSWTGPQSSQATDIYVSVSCLDGGQRGHTLAEVEVLEDADLKSSILCKLQGLIERFSMRDGPRECPACERDDDERKSQHLDEVILVSLGTSPHRVFHASYITHLRLGLAGVRLIRHVVALHGHRVSEALRYPHLVVMGGRRLTDEE